MSNELFAISFAYNVMCMSVVLTNLNGKGDREDADGMCARTKSVLLLNDGAGTLLRVDFIMPHAQTVCVFLLTSSK